MEDLSNYFNNVLAGVLDRGHALCTSMKKDPIASAAVIAGAVIALSNFPSVLSALQSATALASETGASPLAIATLLVGGGAMLRVVNNMKKQIFDLQRKQSTSEQRVESLESQLAEKEQSIQILQEQAQYLYNEYLTLNQIPTNLQQMQVRLVDHEQRLTNLNNDVQGLWHNSRLYEGAFTNIFRNNPDIMGDHREEEDS